MQNTLKKKKLLQLTSKKKTQLKNCQSTWIVISLDKRHKCPIRIRKDTLYPLKVKVKSAQSFPTLCDPPWTVAHQAPPSMGFSRQEYWSGLLFPSPGYLPNPGIKPRSPTLQPDALTSEPSGKPLYPLLLLLLSRFSRVRLCATPWTAAYQAPPSMGFSRQEYWSGLPLPSPLYPLG